MLAMLDLIVFGIVVLLMLGLSFRGAERGETFLFADRAVGFFPLVARW